MFLPTICYPERGSEQRILHAIYSVASGKKREIRHCTERDNYFSETSNTPLADLRTPLTVIIQVLNALNNGMSIKRWLAARQFARILLLYSLCQQFIR